MHLKSQAGGELHDKPNNIVKHIVFLYIHVQIQPRELNDKSSNPIKTIDFYTCYVQIQPRELNDKPNITKLSHKTPSVSTHFMIKSSLGSLMINQMLLYI